MKSESIHDRFKKLRKARGLTVAEMSLLTGIPASTYKEWETGRQIRGEPYLKLAEVFQVSLQELFTGQKPHGAHMLATLDEVGLKINQIKSELISLL